LRVVAERGACGDGTGGHAWDGRYWDYGRGGVGAATGGDGRDIGRGADGWLGDVVGARGCFGGV
jgi:hypothetical protein